MRPNFNEIAGIEGSRDITRGYIQGMGQYIPTQDSILNLKSGGDLRLYEQVAQDDRVKSCLQQRFAGLTCKEVEVLPGGDKRIDKQAAEHLKMQLEALNWDNTTEKMQWGVFYGYSVAEMLWGKADDKVIIQGVRVRNRRRFQFGIDQLPRLLSFDNPLGEILPEQKFWHFCIGADHDDEPYGRGLAHWLYWLTWFKRNDLRWWITFLENFADPSTVGTYPAGATNDEKATLEGAVRSLGKSKWAIKPEGMLVELVEASRSGTADYEAMYKTINEAISQVILSQNMTTESGSSESQARVHQDVGDSVIESDDALISGSFNAGPVKWLTEWNFPGAAIPKVCRKLQAEPDLKAMAEKDKIIVDMGFPANPEYIVETYGEGFKPIESESIQSPLNGAQLTAFVSLITQAQQGGWSPDMVRTSLQISFPSVPAALLDKMAESMKAATALGADLNNPQAPTSNPQTPEQAAQSLDDVAAQFAGAGAIKAKQCLTGLSCGGSCISRTKICKRALSIDQQRTLKELKKRLKGGDLDAAEGIQDLKNKQQGVEKESSPYEDQSLGELFLEADRIGRKYQSQEEIDAFLEADSKAANEIDDLIDKMYPDDAPAEDIGYAKKLAQTEAKTVKKKVSQAYVSAFDNFRKRANDKPPAFDLDNAVKAIEDSDMRKMDKSSATSLLKKLDLSKESHVAYAKASVETAGFYKKQADGNILDTDTGGTTSSFDRSNELMRISNRKEISDDDADEAGGFLRQGLRGGAGSAVNKANILLAQDIWNRLSDSQKDIFAKQIPESYVETSFDRQLSDNPFVKELIKRRG